MLHWLEPKEVLYPQPCHQIHSAYPGTTTRCFNHDLSADLRAYQFVSRVEFAPSR